MVECHGRLFLHRAGHRQTIEPISVLPERGPNKKMSERFAVQVEDRPVLPVEQRIVFTVDLAGNFKFINCVAERLTGYSCAEARRMNVLDLLSPDCAWMIPKFVKRSVRNRFGTVFEIEITTKDRRRVTLETSIDVVKLSDGTVELRGIAVAQRKDVVVLHRRPRCLDERFRFRTPMTSE